MRILDDDLGYPVSLIDEPIRIVSLVPSLTQAVEETESGLIVAATDYCIAPAELDVIRVRGTKNPNRKTIIDLQPHLVIANKEENRRTDIEALREAGLPVWVTCIDSINDAFTSMTRLFAEVLHHHPSWLDEAREVWAPPPRFDLAAALPIWRDPWMVVGGETFSSDLLARIGIRNVFADRPRYPRIELEEIAAAPLVLLPDEPYPFSETDGPECFQRSALVNGQATAWYGPAMTWSRDHLECVLGEYAS